MTDSTELVATEQPQQVALTVQDRAVIALGGIEREEALKALAKKYADITEVKNKAGRQQVHAAAMELANERITTKKTGETAREDANALQKAVIERQKVLIGLVEPEEKRLLVLRDKWDEVEEAERQAKLAAEQQRIAAIRARIDGFRNRPAEMIGMPSDEIGEISDVLSETVIDLATYMEFAGEAQVERDHVVKKLREMQAAQAAVEQEQARLAEERAQLERDRAAVAEHARKEAAARAEREEAEREQRLIAEEEQRLIQERAAAAMRAEQEAHSKRMADQQAELDAKQAAIDAAIAEQERIAREARKAAEAAARLESDHAEALIENDRIDAERAAAIERQRIADAEAAEARRKREELEAAEAERIHRELIEFEKNGPGDVEIVKRLAGDYGVTVGDVMGWMKKFDYTATDEQLAAENVAANHMEKAA